MYSRSWIKSLMTVLMALSFLTGCSEIEKSKNQSVESFILLPNNPTEPIEGEQMDFKSFLVFFDKSFENATQDTNWSSSDPAVATIENNGTAVFHAQGDTLITARYTLENTLYEQSTQLHVRENLLRSISITPSDVNVSKGFSRRFHATGTFSNGSTHNISKFVQWSSSRPQIASISKKTFFALAETNSSANVADETIITAISTTAALSASARLRISDATLISIMITHEPMEVHVDDTVVFSAEGNFSDGSQHDVSADLFWKSSDDTVLKFKALKPNEANALSSADVNITASEKKLLGLKQTLELKVLP